VSQENVEIVRRATEAHQRHDNEAVLSLYDPEVEMALPDFDGSIQVYRGPDGVRAWYRELLEAITEFTTTVDEWIDGGNEVIAVLRLAGRGRKSGAPFERREAHVWTVRNGKLWRLRVYGTREEALKAVGLEEQRCRRQMSS
jgi:ketosteroid isomerase-like protein